MQRPAQDGLVLDMFPGTAWFAQGGEVLDAVEALPGAGSVDPPAIREVNSAFWEVTPFYCPDCGLSYCRGCRTRRVVSDEGSCDCTEGTCPGGHRHLPDG